MTHLPEDPKDHPSPWLAKRLLDLARLSLVMPVVLMVLIGLGHGFNMAWLAIFSVVPAVVATPFLAAAGYFVRWGATLRGAEARTVWLAAAIAAVNGFGGWYLTFRYLVGVFA